MVQGVRTRALHRAAELVGGVENLRAMLGASPEAMKVWMSGSLPPPMNVFLKVVDILSAPPTDQRKQVRQLSAELREKASIIRERLARTRERAEAACAAAVAGRLASVAKRSGAPPSVLGFLQRIYDPGEAATMVDDAISAAVAGTGADMGTLQVRRPEGLVLVAHRGFAQPFLDHFSCVTAEVGSACGAAAQKSQRVIVSEVQSDPIFVGTASAKVLASANVKAVQATPLVSPDGELVGMISTHWEHVWRPGERELDIVDSIARRTAFWLDGGEL